MKKQVVFLAMLPLVMANSCIFVESNSGGSNNSSGDHSNQGSQVVDRDHMGTISSDELWQSDNYVTGNLYIEAEVTIDTGATVYMDPNASIIVRNGGSLQIMGDKGTGNSVLFTSSAAEGLPGDWNTIEISKTAAKTSEFNYVTFEFGGFDNNSMVFVDSDIIMDNVTFRGAKAYALELSSTAHLKVFNNVSFEEMDGADLIWTDVNRVAELKNFQRDSTDIGRIVASGRDVTLSGSWGPFDAPLALTEGAVIGSTDDSITISATDVEIRLPKDGQISVNNAGFNMKNVTVTTLNLKQYWDYIYYSSVSSSSTIENCTFIDGNASWTGSSDKGYGYLWFDDGADVSVSNVTFQDTQDSRSGVCYVTNRSSNTSIDELITKARSCI